MQKWTDKHGTEHAVDLDIQAAKDLRDNEPTAWLDLIGCLADPSKIEPMVAQLASDPLFVIPILALLEGADDVKQFSRLLHGSALEDASNALTRAIIDFFREPQKSIMRQLHERTLAIANEVRETATREATEAIDNPDFSTAVRNLLTGGNGLNASSELSGTTAAG